MRTNLRVFACLALVAATASAQTPSSAIGAASPTSAISGPDSRSNDQEDQRARGLVRIGEDGIARENNAALDAYFAKRFVFHGPGGDMDYDQLKAHFAAMRAAFSGFAVTRPAILVNGDFVAARTTMTGTFTGPFVVPTYGTLTPTNKPMKLELINIFRYDAEGKLAEEWVQYDTLGFLRQLGMKFDVEQ